MLLTTTRHASEILSNPNESRRQYRFSTDQWSADVVRELKRRLEHKQTSCENAVGVVIGSGGLPYILAYAGLTKIYLVDVHADAILATIIRVRSLKHHQSWLKYRRALSEDLSGDDASRFVAESHRAVQSGLMVDYLPTQQSATSVDLWGVTGDFRKTAPYIAGLVASKGELVAYVNATNAADTISTRQLGIGKTSGMLELGKAIGALPLADDVVIVDSSGNLIPRIFSETDYPGVQ